MPSFSDKSRAILDTCDRRLQAICEDVIEHCDFTVLEGHRSNERQDELFHQGKSKLRAGQSKHNHDPSLAVDLAPYPINWNETRRFYFLAGRIIQAGAELGIRIRWGGDWDSDSDFSDQTFNDLPHFEIVE